MTSMAERVMQRFYVSSNGDASKLPWHREEPVDLLIDTVQHLPAGSRVLDVGCGAGVFAVWMSSQGMEVTAIDRFPEAITMAQQRASQNAVDVTWVCADLFELTADAPYDLVFDSGCLHSLVGGHPSQYKEQLLRWMAPEGTFVVEHWGKRHRLDWRPIGPRRRTPAQLAKLFGPQLESDRVDENDFAAPLPFGPTVRAAAYRFTRS